MCKRKKKKIEQAPPIYCVSEEAIDFIRTYVLPIKQIDWIDEDVLYEIFELAEEWELDMIDENGDDDPSNPFFERDTKGMDFVSELSGQEGDPDLDDLNRRLGLSKKDEKPTE